ncbi:hypothetical protein GGP41_009821 [Bipolaris sorokiniana]|uniref:Uncharacterized protein n=2 Tax=Cochliobolus sativus TaxID=45130 RepID=A0A8H5ZG90_COCSA|nr:uncharacterized protein COCSADRAFT_192710 [Bipolaris sorokiniana ND90Pr]EMD60873.1 hypothetical protein COCSADRAFT_192710 [Bipolaris sorokiniana ND90Pr]KAF5848691.1 hypothetical protein GGP41_009821 [Bipolaris sorokiniana]
MHFDLLSLKAKKSISQLLCRKNDTESTFSGVDRNLIERGTTPGPSPDKASVRPNTNDSPSSNESPSRRKGLVGSLKENKLRSINSLRSLRSPTKAKQPDLDASPCADSPRTPLPRPRSSLLLTFQESPADELLFDLSRTDSTNFGHNFCCSSPLPIPSSENQKPQSFALPSVIPDGTIPSSPAPLRKLLDLDQNEDFPSPMFGPAFDLDLACVDLLAPLQDDMQESHQIQGTSRETTGVVQAAIEHRHVPTRSPESEQPSTDNTTDLVNDRRFMQGDSIVHELTEKFHQRCLNMNEGMTDPSNNVLMIIGKDYMLRVFHNGDLKRRIGITACNGHGYAPDNESEMILARREEDFAAAERILPELGRFVVLNRDMLGNTNRELVLDEALAEGILPEWLDLNLDMEITERLHSRISNAGKRQNRESTWGQHVGLYDGTGYGTGSSSRSSTAGETGMDDACHYVEKGNPEDNIADILPGVYEKTYPFRSTPDSSR